MGPVLTEPVTAAAREQGAAPRPALAGRAPIAAWLLLAILTIAAWALALRGAFQYDDWPNIVLDPATSDAAALRERLGNGFRPLLRLSYAADHALWGFTAAGFLFTNLLLHLGTVAAVFALAQQRLARSEELGQGGFAMPFAAPYSALFPALCAAAVFALQPAHAAVVASASGRSSGLSTLLIVLALLMHERARDAAAGAAKLAAKVATAASLLLFALAVAAKEVALVFPLLVLLWEWTRPAVPGGSDRPTLVRRVAPAFIAAALFAAIAFAFSPRLRELTAFSLALASPIDALQTNVAALATSLALWFQPWALAIEHPRPSADAWWPAALLPLAMVAAALAAHRRGHRLVALALLWPLVALLPTHSLLARHDPVVEKALYAAWIGPSLGLGAALAAMLSAAARRRGRAVALTLAVAVAGTAAGACAWRAARWADPVALWREASEAAPLSARAWRNRALAELGARRIDDARRSLARSMALEPNARRSDDLARALSLFESEAGSEALPSRAP